MSTEPLRAGTLVMRQEQGLLRIGTILSAEKGEEDWTFFRVRFFEDNIYERKLALELGGRPGTRVVDDRKYRADEIKPIGPHWLRNVLFSYGEYQNERRTEND